MDKTTYQQELQEVRYTDAGRAALVEQLMAARTAEPDGRSGRRKNWGRRGAVVLLAAVLLVTAAAAATAPLWMRYFGGLDEQQQAVVEAMQTTGDGLPPAAEGGGVTITPISILGSGNQLYITLEIRAPEEVVFSEEKGRYDLLAHVKPKEPPKEMVGSTSHFTVLEAGTEAPNVLTGVLEITSSCDLGGGTLEIRGLSLWKDRGQDEWIFEGEWAIPLPEDITGKQMLEPKVEGVAVETEQGTFTLDAVSISPLGVWWQYRFDGANEPVIYTALGMKDGSRVETAPGQMILGHPGGHETATATFAKPVDLAQAVSLYWGNMEIPLDGQGEARVDENIPVIRDEPAFCDLPAGGEEAGERERAAQPESGKETELRATNTGLTAASKPGGGGLTEFQQQRDEYYLKTLSLSGCEMIHNELVTDEFVYQEAPYGEVRFGIDYLTFAEDGYARASYWSRADETCILAVYKDKNGGTWGRAFRVPEELIYDRAQAKADGGEQELSEVHAQEAAEPGAQTSGSGLNVTVNPRLDTDYQERDRMLDYYDTVPLDLCELVDEQAMGDIYWVASGVHDEYSVPLYREELERAACDGNGLTRKLVTVCNENGVFFGLGFRDSSGALWGRTYRVPEELLYTGN